MGTTTEQSYRRGYNDALMDVTEQCALDERQKYLLATMYVPEHPTPAGKKS